MKLKLFLCISFLFIGLVYIAPKDAFWVTDGGNKFIQTQNLLLSGKISIPYMAEDIDKDKVFFPYCGHHFQQNGEWIYSVQPPYFPYISSFFYKAFGSGGIYVLPVVCGILCILLTTIIVKTFSLNSYLSETTPAIIGLCTPLFFYSLVFWEHTLSLFFFLSGLLILFKNFDSNAKKTLPYIYLAGMLLGISTLFREDSYIATGALIAAMLITGTWKKALPLTAGWFTVILPLWIFQKLFFGFFLGFHAMTYSRMNANDTLYALIVEKFSNLNMYLFKFIPAGMPSWLFWTLIASFVISAAAGLITKATNAILKFKLILLFINFISSIIMFSFLSKSPSPVFDTISTQGAITAVPFVSIFLVFSGNLLMEKDRKIRILTIFTVLFTMLTCIALSQKDYSIIWGPRYFLVLYPAITIMVIFCMEKLSVLNDKALLKKLFLAASVLLFFASFLIQSHGVKTLYNKKIYSENLVTKLSDSNDVIVTDVFWLPEEISSLYFKKKIMQVRKTEDLKILKELLRKNNCERFTLVLSPLYRLIKNEDMAVFMNGMKITSKQMVTYTKVSFMSLMILECEMDTGKIKGPTKDN